MAFNLQLGGSTVSQDRYWQWMEENQNWNTQAAVDAITPYKSVTEQVEDTRRGGYKTVTRTNKNQRSRDVAALNERYKSVKDKDRMISTPILQMGAADAGAQNLRPQSEADVVTPESTGTDTRPDFGGSADSGRNPAAGRATQDAGTAGANVDDKLQGRRRTAGGLRI